MAASSGKSKRTFEVLIGCDVGEGYHEIGSIIDNVPARQVPAWIAEGVIVPVDPKTHERITLDDDETKDDA